MGLYQEIILLATWFRGKYCVENVVGYYDPLIPPTQFGSHYFWTNFYFPTNGLKTLYRGVESIPLKDLAKMKGFNLQDLEGIDKKLALRDVTEPELAKHIFDFVLKPYVPTPSMF